MLRDSTAAAVVHAHEQYTTANDIHEKINSWVSFSLYDYGAPLGVPSGRGSSAISTRPMLEVSNSAKRRAYNGV